MKTLIVDDERLARNELIKLLEKFPEIEIPKMVIYNAEALKNTPVTAIKTPKRPINSMLPESPSRYSTKTKPINTSIVPGSGWIMIKKAGVRTSDAAMILFFIFCVLTFIKLKYLAKAKLHPNLANSEGWMENPPNWNQDFAPLTDGINNTIISNKRTREYMT